MALLNVITCCLDSIREISEELEGAIVYLDGGCTESFKYIGAFPLLLELGVHAVCSLENMSSLDVVVDWNPKFDYDGKLVVFTSRLLSDAHRYVLRSLSSHQRARRCTIFTSISEVAQGKLRIRLENKVVEPKHRELGGSFGRKQLLKDRGRERKKPTIRVDVQLSDFTIAHSAYPDSPLGPDAFHEYEVLLAQDYEELKRRPVPNSKHTHYSNFNDKSNSEDEGWSQLSPTEEVITNFNGMSITGDMDEVDRPGHLEDVGQKLIVSVHHFPLILCPFSPRFFVLPSEGSVAEAYLAAQHENSISAGLPPLSTRMISDVEDVPPGATLTAQFLYHLTTKMDLKLEIFSLGDLSKTVGKLMTDMSSLYDVGRRKRSAGLLLVDRTLDLLTPCCHGDSLLDRIFSAVPRKSQTSSSQVNGSESKFKHGYLNVRRSPLDIQIPLAEILGEEDSNMTRDFQLVDTIEAFLKGWNANDSASQINDLLNLSKKLHGHTSLISESDLLSGSLVATESFNGARYLESLLDRRTKDGTILIKKWLQESLRGEKISVNSKRVPSKSELRHLIRALAKNQSSLVRNKGIIQLAAATSYAMAEKHCAKWDALISAEKMLNVSAGDTSQSLSAQICDIINKSSLMKSQMESSQELLSLPDALLLTVIGYILAGENFPTSGLAGPFSWQEEHFLKEAIMDALLENPQVAKLKFLHGLTDDLEAKLTKDNRTDEMNQETSDLLESNDFDDDQWGAWGDEDVDSGTNKEEVYSDMQLKLELRDRVDNLFKFLHKLSSLNKNILLREGNLGCESNISYDPSSRKGLLHKLLTRLLAKYDVPGLEYHSSTVGRLFKSGFGRFGLGQAKSNLADQNVILVFVLGGINCVEFLEVQEALSQSSRPDIELILGGTTLLTPADMLVLLLGDSSYV